MPMSAAAISSQARTQAKVPMPAPPSSSGYGRPVRPELARALEQRAVVALLLVPLRRAGRHLALGPVANGVADAALLVAERERVAGAAAWSTVIEAILVPCSS